VTGGQIVSSPASERGGHGRPRAPGAPAQHRARPGTRPASASPRPVPGGPRPGRHGAAPATRRSPQWRPSRRSKIVLAAVIAVGVLVIGLATGFGSELSAEPTAQAFLLSWQQQDYAAAGALTTAPPRTVAADLKGAFAQLDATQMLLSMNSLVQHGATAEASFVVSVDLAGPGRVWTYQSRFGMRRTDGRWKVEWAPSVVHPSLTQGERLAVVTKFPARASVLDAEGEPLQVPSQVYVLGVRPGQLADPARTASQFAGLTGLDARQVLGQINAAPPADFLALASLDPGTYATLRSGLRSVPGLVVEQKAERLYQAEATGLVGSVGSEISQVLRADGTFYLPGTTVGLSGLEQAYQRELVGTPTTEVVAVTSAGTTADILAAWAGTPGIPVRTTIESKVQDAALTALGNASASGEIVAVQAMTGQVLAVAQHQAAGAPALAGAFDAKLIPGMAFTIVSTAALLSTKLTAATPISCENSFTVGGQTFTSHGTGEVRPFSNAFANQCDTAFVGLSERINASQLTAAVREFGIGADWSQLPVHAFSGSAPTPAGDAALAAETIGQGNVRMSPLAMAMVAAVVDSGSWHTPVVIQGAPDPVGNPLNPAAMSALRDLMRNTVSSGAAQAASRPGAPVYGQVGLVHTGSTWTSWFVGFRGNIAFTVVESGKTAQLSAAALAGAFLSALGP
jgi:cell division protein FtsI/penicillin-binding protein 2